MWHSQTLICSLNPIFSMSCFQVWQWHWFIKLSIFAWISYLFYCGVRRAWKFSSITIPCDQL
jgi:hypothetical protein